MTRRSTTLATRLIVASTIAAVVALVAANALAYVQLRRTLLERVDASLRTVRIPKGVLGTDDRIKGDKTADGKTGDNTADGKTGDKPDEGVGRLAPTFYFETRAPDGTTTSQFDATDDRGRALRPKLPTQLDLTGTSSAPDGIAKFFTVEGIGTSSQFRVKASLFRDGGALILAATLDDMHATLSRTLRSQILITAVVTALAAALAAIGVKRSLRPLTHMERVAGAIAAGDRQARVDPSGPRDVQELGDSFNKMVDELHQAITAEAAASATTRRFVDDAAHELRTPITAVAAYADLLTGSQTRSPEESARISQGIATETDRLRRLIEELLYLARVDQQPEGEKLERFDLVPIALQAVDTSMLVGPSWPIDLDTPEQAWCVGSPSEIRRVLDNLLSNIRTHTPAGTDGRIAISVASDAVTVRVEDSGPGVPSEEAERLFDRFWRGDDSRARSTGGTGLGLSIVQAVIERHHGTVRAERNDRGGISVVITLPAVVGH